MSHDPREANELRRHIFANHIDYAMLKRLLRLIYAPCGACSSPEACQGHAVSLDSEKIANELDIKPESLATILSYLHLQSEEQRSLTILQSSPEVSGAYEQTLFFYFTVIGLFCLCSCYVLIWVKVMTTD